MKLFVTLLTLLACSASFAQTRTIYARFTKSDGSRIKGTSTFKGYEDQVIILNYTGGSDNTATIGIEIATSACVADFRNAMAASQPATEATRIQKTVALKASQPAPISKVEISSTTRTGNAMPNLTSQIILQDVKVESCTDIAASGTTKIKLKANRIGWIYYSTDPKTGRSVAGNKSGWDLIAGASWTNF